MTVPTNAKTDAGGVAYAHYMGLILLLLAVIGLGYAGFRYFATVVMPQPGAYYLPTLAVIAGVASFFSPCAFPLLPSYLSFYTEASGNSIQGARSIRALVLGLAAAAGVLTFTLILGTIIGLLGTSTGKALSISGPEPSRFVLWLRGSVGVMLVALGLAQWFNVNLKPGIVDKLAWYTRPNRQGNGGATTLYLYGLGYTAAGMGCTGPILAGLTVFALSTGGFSAALTAFVIFALTMGGLMLLVSGLVATSQETLIQQLKATTPRIKQVTSILLVLVGLFNIFTALNIDLFVRWLFP
jgi:cytochrome c-type biogenesis protein